MAVRIHYGGSTYIEAKYDLEDTIDRINKVLKSQRGSGIVRVTTDKGTVDLLVSTAIPIAVENHEPVAKKPAVKRLL